MRTLLIVISIFGAWVSGAPARADAVEHRRNRTDYTGQASQTWQILDYLADDYRGAVADGRVVSASEYAEMREFADAVRTQLHALPAVPASSALQEAADRLARSIADKDAADGVARQAHGARRCPPGRLSNPDGTARRTGSGSWRTDLREHLRRMPRCGWTWRWSRWSSAATRPVEFHRSHPCGRAQRCLSLYQAVTHGVPGTAMPSFPQLGTADRWAVAFHAGSLAYTPYVNAGEARWRLDAQLRAHVPDLGTLVRGREDQWAPLFGADGAAAALGYLRAHPEALAAGPRGIALARAQLAASVSAYRSGRAEDAARLALSAYLDGIEPIEPTLAAGNDNLRIQLETHMAQYRAAVLNHASETVAAQSIELNRLLAATDQELAASQATPTTAFLGAFTILVREGLEALLIVLAIDRVPSQAHRDDAVRYVHIGWTLALAAGAVTWVVATLRHSGQRGRPGSYRGFVFRCSPRSSSWCRHLDASEECRRSLASVFARQTLRGARSSINDFLIWAVLHCRLSRSIRNDSVLRRAVDRRPKACIGAGLFAGTITLAAWRGYFCAPVAGFRSAHSSRRVPCSSRFLRWFSRQGNAGLLQEAGWLATTARCVSAD